MPLQNKLQWKGEQMEKELRLVFIFFLCGYRLSLVGHKHNHL